MNTDAEQSVARRSREDLTAAAGMYGLLARLWRREVDAELTSFLQSEPLHESIRSVGLVGAELTGESAIDELAADFCRIFLGPRGHIPPHQSVWQEGVFQGDLTESLLAFRDTIGVLVDQDDSEFAPQNMIDHASTLLRMMQTVCAESSTCNAEQLATLNDLAESFFENHVMWIGSYCSRAETIAQTQFYRSLLQVSRTFLESEHAVFFRRR